MLPLDSDRQVFIDSYRKLFTLAFTYFFSIFIFFCAGVVSYFLLSNHNQATTNTLLSTSTLQERETKLMSSSAHLFLSSDTTGEIIPHIIQGTLHSSTGSRTSNDNLLSYQDIILPNYLSLSKNFPFTSYDSFVKNQNYDPANIDAFIDNIIFYQEDFPSAPAKRQTLPVYWSLEEQFNLSCLFESKLFPFTCTYYTKHFLNSFFLYSIQQDYDGFDKIFNQIHKNSTQENILCQNLKKYVLYSTDTNTRLTPLFATCGDSYEERFSLFSSFIDTHKQLENTYITIQNTQHTEVNMYKLLSFQQILTKDLSSQRINTDRISMYLSYLQNLQKFHLLTGFYLDEAFVFTNKYLKPELEKHPFSLEHKEESDLFIRDINTLNNGDSLKWFSGFIELVQNTALLQSLQSGGTGSKFTPNSGSWDFELSPEAATLKKILDNLSYFHPVESSFDGNKIHVKGLMSIQLSDTKEKLITAIFDLSYINNILYVTKISIPDEKELTSFLNGILEKKTSSFSSFYYYIAKNAMLFDTANSLHIDTNAICNSLSWSIKDWVLSSCDASHIVVKRTIKEKEVTFNIQHTNFVLRKIAISDSSIQKDLQSYINDIDSSQAMSTNGGDAVNFVQQLISIINYEPGISNPSQGGVTPDTEGSSNALLIVEAMKQYLGVTVDDLAEKGNKISISFTLGDIPFIASYDVKSHTLAPIYFKTVLTKDLPTQIKNLSLSLDEANKTTISLFVLDPLSYIKQVNPQAYIIYKKAQDPLFISN